MKEFVLGGILGLFEYLIIYYRDNWFGVLEIVTIGISC